MIALICFVLAVLASPFKSNIRLEAENAVLTTHAEPERMGPLGPCDIKNNIDCPKRPRWPANGQRRAPNVAGGDDLVRPAVLALVFDRSMVCGLGAAELPLRGLALPG